MSNSLLLIFFLSLHSLRLSGDCHNIGSGLSLIWVRAWASVLLGKWAMNYIFLVERPKQMRAKPATG
jgi:hypothetical protein